MLWLYRWICGYLALDVTGDVPEILLNLCSKNGIALWNVKRVKRKMKCRVTVRDFRKMGKLIRHSGVRVHIAEKHGFPFFTIRYQKRWGIPAGAVLFFTVLKLMSCFIWSIEVSGNTRLSDEEILSACKTAGVQEGAYADAIDYKTASQKLLLAMPDLAWASLNLEGCRVTVNVSESEPVDRYNTQPCNLKAKADGVIMKVDIQAGDCLVKVGDIVSRGDLLVSGVVEKGGLTHLVHAAGAVTAQTAREICVSAFGLNLPLYLGKIKPPYESESRTAVCKIRGVTLPIRLHKKTFWFTQETERTYSKEELEKVLIAQTEELLKVENITQFEVKNREFDERNGNLSLKTFLLAQEEISVEEILLFSAGNN